MKHVIEMEPEQVDAIVVAELRSSIDSLEQDLERNQDIPEDDYLGVFDNDKNLDAARIVEYIEALKLVLSYYSGESTTF